MTPTEQPRQRSVREIPASAVVAGDVIWAPNDGDWLCVHRMTAYAFEITFYRRDGSEAAFDPDKTVLVLA